MGILTVFTRKNQDEREKESTAKSDKTAGPKASLNCPILLCFV
ncbi:hypothetical protein CLOLEP_03777 [[Clostridium] leptum DSM 753]|uniref:Uncharacterized protein n=1 Tax=[Clostridium] leptum DSM 753 TaxID=428125 RepID=A7VYU9_9FIRM|nr:hypothetical protein CLOLEP_03777 [[Clostridium] leptum DSM 753]